MITVKELYGNYNSISENIEHCKSLRKRIETPYPGAKPTLSTRTPSDEDITEYQRLVKAHETSKILYEKEREEVSNYNKEIDSVIEEYIKKASNFYNLVPSECQSGVWRLAWEYGDSSGYSEVYSYLSELIELFTPIKRLL